MSDQLRDSLIKITTKPQASNPHMLESINTRFNDLVASKVSNKNVP